MAQYIIVDDDSQVIGNVEAKNMKDAASQVMAAPVDSGGIRVGLDATIYRVAGPARRVSVVVETVTKVEIT